MHSEISDLFEIPKLGQDQEIEIDPDIIGFSRLIRPLMFTAQ